MNGSQSRAVQIAKETAEEHIEEFFMEECRSHGLLVKKRGIIAVAAGIGFIVFVAVPLTLAAIKVISDIYDNRAEIRKLKEEVKFVNFETGQLNKTVEV